jgi:hypothetical protein
VIHDSKLVRSITENFSFHYYQSVHLNLVQHKCYDAKLSVTIKLIMLGAITWSPIMLNLVMLSAVILSDIILCAIRLIVIALCHYYKCQYA